MLYRNETHRAAFAETVEGLNQKDFALMSALYLLTADRRLLQAARPLARNGVINPDAIRIKDCNVNIYTLLCAAKDLYLGTKHLTVSDLADPNLIPPKLFALICNAMAIRRFGLGAIQYEERNGKDD